MTTKTYTEAELMGFIKAGLRFGFNCGIRVNPDYTNYPVSTLKECEDMYLGWVSANLAVANTVKES